MTKATPDRKISSGNLARALGGFLPPPGYRAGLLGGSFNPAHEGHRMISLVALKRLGLDEVWWLVSPQNPLKPAEGMADLAQRLDSARRIADHPRIRVTALESALGTQYTAETLRALTCRLPRVSFVWVMGADNLQQIPAWKDWMQIFHLLPVAILDRPSYALGALAGLAARRFSRWRKPERAARRLPEMEPPAWVFLHGPLSTQSATRIRAARISRSAGLWR
ncbi:MAG: nicotinate-nucleotide adenylyltransferase [Kiloniellales bacterium]|nr:nicotinate-nucleotide adenylyltransferase [Kiloniellales bacterium]